jgi:ADP-ribosylglycohydrolase
VISQGTGEHLLIGLARCKADRRACRERQQGDAAVEPLAIALFCALAAPNFEEAVVWPSITPATATARVLSPGTFAGALYGDGAIPARWLDRLELRDEITAMTDDLAGVRQDTLDVDSDETLERYPGW